MRDTRGFTLLEVLVAGAIAALGLAVLLHTALTGVAIARAAGDYEMATELARSRLALLGRDVSALPEQSRGHDGAFAWRLRVVPTRMTAAGPGTIARLRYAAEPRAVLYQVTLDVSWRGGGGRRFVHVETRRLGFVRQLAAAR